ncbi:hypothetical protein KP509_29G075300 [Ceratopteris richardii]|uniref:CobW C-terminal domain-containing protein n=1 Tax=Ceratopteris richardii TaxID=49495 RepID=A0A8T2R842_CERRI|nr:hypothetical protein KP509_29G075300 [Ceratopteris richardii]
MARRLFYKSSRRRTTLGLVEDDLHPLEEVELCVLYLQQGCACCKVRGEFKEAVEKVLHGKHDFDYLIVETSGLADPVKIAKDLQALGVQLDVIVTLVDVEMLDRIVKLPTALNQLLIADIVLINKCDLATLGTISDVEDLIEGATDGCRAVRCRFCRVPLNLVLNLSNLQPKPSSSMKTVQTLGGVVSHETCSQKDHYTTFPQARNGTEKSGFLEKKVPAAGDGDMSRPRLDMVAEAHPLDSVSSLSFASSAPLILSKVQNIVTKHMFHLKGLIRAKGVLWLHENRNIRLAFHWSGKKRPECTYNGQWECPPYNSIVFLGLDMKELECLVQAFADAQIDSHSGIANHWSREHICEKDHFIETLAADCAFKVYKETNRPQGSLANHCQGPVADDAQTYIVFGLVGSPLQGVSEADLNEALVRLVNARGVLFLTGVTSSRQDHLLQIAFSDTDDFENVWKELSEAAASVRAKYFKNTYRCRCDLKEHNHQAQHQ